MYYNNFLNSKFHMSNFHKHTVIYKEFLTPDTFVLRLKPTQKEVFPFVAGQYTRLKNPNFKPEEAHTFSISSSPNTKEYLEFCIKTYGEWTQQLLQIEKGDELFVQEPEGNFTRKSHDTHMVYLAGGLGISPIMSMLRYIHEEKHNADVTLLYGSRTENTIAYKKEVEQMEKDMPHLKVVHILSHLEPTDPWKGYRGFINEDIIKNEVNLEKNPVFFIIGPPIFIEKMKEMLVGIGVKESQFRLEHL
jgi:ferredoxin-NADP reductase